MGHCKRSFGHGAGVLVAISNQGTRTQTTHQDGNLLSGLFGGVASGFAGGWGSAAGKAFFGG